MFLYQIALSSINDNYFRSSTTFLKKNVSNLKTSLFQGLITSIYLIMSLCIIIYLKRLSYNELYENKNIVGRYILRY